MKNLVKKIYCCMWAWGAFAILFLFSAIYDVFPCSYISKIPLDWCLSIYLAFAFVVLVAIYKAIVKCRRLNAQDFCNMGILYFLCFFFVFNTPLANNFGKENVKILSENLMAFGPLIVGSFTAFFACKQSQIIQEQKEIQNKQHNASLFDKRYTLFGDFEKLIKNIFDCDGNGEMDLDYRETSLNLSIFSYKSEILFNIEIKKNIDCLIELLKELHDKEPRQKDFATLNQKQIKEHEEELKNQVKIIANFEEKAANVCTQMLNFIKDNEI